MSSIYFFSVVACYMLISIEKLAQNVHLDHPQCHFMTQYWKQVSQYRVIKWHCGGSKCTFCANYSIDINIWHATTLQNIWKTWILQLYLLYFRCFTLFSKNLFQYWVVKWHYGGSKCTICANFSIYINI